MTTGQIVNFRGFLTPLSLSADWFLALRRVAVIGQIITVLHVRYLLGVNIAILPLGMLIGVTAISNVILSMCYKQNQKQSDSPHPFEHAKLWSAILLGVMAFDLIMLTGLLYYSGGVANPFFVFYFVNLCLAGIVLPPRFAWCLNFLAVFCFGFLLYDHVSLDALGLGTAFPSIRKTGQLTLAHNGIFVAFTTCSTVIVYFATLITSRLRKQQQDVQLLEERRAKGDKLEALGTLAAGAAHELATPLGTIAIVIREMEIACQKQVDDPMLLEDFSLVRAELNRCRSILDRMSTKAGQATVEQAVLIRPHELIELILAELPHSSGVEVVVDEQVRDRTLSAPRVLLSQALRGLVKNGIEAARANQKGVVCRFHEGAFSSGKPALQLSIIDQGEGMSPEVLARVGEPFFTTKPTGRGMGLGLFLARSVMERLGGRLEIESESGTGTQVCCLFPVENVTAKS